MRSVGAKDPSFLHADSEDSDQTGRHISIVDFDDCRPIKLLLNIEANSLTHVETLSCCHNGAQVRI